MNKVLLLGRLTKEPDIKYSQTSNIKVAKFTLAVNRRYVKEGEERKADFFSIIAYSKLADFIEKYLTTGIQINVCGRLQNRNWMDENNQRHYITEVIAEEIYFADSRKKSEKANVNILCGNGKATESVQTIEENNEFILEEDDLPF